jgi:hypothetical protein
VEVEVLIDTNTSLLPKDIVHAYRANNVLHTTIDSSEDHSYEEAQLIATGKEEAPNTGSTRNDVDVEEGGEAKLIEDDTPQNSEQRIYGCGHGTCQTRELFIYPIAYADGLEVVCIVEKYNKLDGGDGKNAEELGGSEICLELLIRLLLCLVRSLGRPLINPPHSRLQRLFTILGFIL